MPTQRKRRVAVDSKPSDRASRRRPYAFVVQVLLGTVAVGALSIGLMLALGGDGVAEPRVLDELSYQRVERLREALAVTNSDLAVLGVTTQQAEGVIERVLSWSDANSERLARADRALRDAETQVRLERRAIQSGQVQETNHPRSYAQLVEAIDKAKADRTAVLTELETALTSLLQGSSDDWTAAKLNAGWVTGSLSDGPVEDAANRATAMREAKQGQDPEASSAQVQGYRDRLAGVSTIARVERQIYQKKVIPKPVVLFEDLQ